MPNILTVKDARAYTEFQPQRLGGEDAQRFSLFPKVIYFGSSRLSIS